MTKSWDELLAVWLDQHHQVAFDLPVEYKSDGSKSVASCRRVLTELIEPVFNEAGECLLFGTRFADDSFRGEGAQIKEALRSQKNRKSIAHEPDTLTRFVHFFANEREDDRMLKDQRGTVLFVVPETSPALERIMRDLAKPEIVRNYPTTMDRAALNFARENIGGKTPRAVVCLPGRMGLDVLYVFARAYFLRMHLGLP